MSLILENMYDIVHHSPYQCYDCKYYFNHKEDLIEHFKKHHLQQEEEPMLTNNNNSSPTAAWNCSACTSNQFLPNGFELLKHLNSSSHKKVELAIAKSIPIIIRSIILRGCTIQNCNKSFLLNRELISHLRIVHGSQTTVEVDPIIETRPITAAAVDDGYFETDCKKITGSDSDQDTYGAIDLGTMMIYKS